MIVTGGNKICMIPVSLCIIAFFSSFGPWGAFNISRNSQVKELTTLLDSNHVLKNGMADTTSAHDVTAQDYIRIQDIVRYLDNVHGYKTLQPFFALKLDSVIPRDSVTRFPEWSSNSDIIVSLMKLNKLPSPADSVAASGHFYKSPYSEMVSS